MSWFQIYKKLLYGAIHKVTSVAMWTSVPLWPFTIYSNGPRGAVKSYGIPSAS